MQKIFLENFINSSTIMCVVCMKHVTYIDDKQRWSYWLLAPEMLTEWQTGDTKSSFFMAYNTQGSQKARLAMTLFPVFTKLILIYISSIKMTTWIFTPKKHRENERNRATHAGMKIDLYE